MDIIGAFFPGLRDERPAHSQRSYSYDPKGTRSVQSSQYPEPVEPQADNIALLNIFGHFSPRPPAWPETGLLGNITELFKPAFFSSPDWWATWFSNDWNALRAEGVGYGIYNPHLPMSPLPVAKLYEPGSGFILPATFLGQPLAPAVKPPGT